MNLSTFSFKIVRFFKRIVIKVKYKYKPFTILANNCIAGFLYNYYGLQFTSPIINCQIAPDDFIRFCSNLDIYLNEPVIEIINPTIDAFEKLGGSNNIDFPVGKIKDITVYFQHYHSFTNAVHKWETRKKRIMHNIFVILVDTNCTQETYQMFLQVPFKNKIFLTGNKNITGTHVFYMKDMQKNNAYWFDDRGHTHKKYYEQFDFLRWFIKN